MAEGVRCQGFSRDGTGILKMFRALDRVMKFMHPRRPSLWLNPAAARILGTNHPARPGISGDSDAGPFHSRRYANTGPHGHPHPNLPQSRGKGLFTLHRHCCDNPFSSSYAAPTTRHSEERSDAESKKPRDQDDNAAVGAVRELPLLSLGVTMKRPWTAMPPALL